MKDAFNLRSKPKKVRFHTVMVDQETLDLFDKWKGETGVSFGDILIQMTQFHKGMENIGKPIKPKKRRENND